MACMYLQARPTPQMPQQQQQQIAQQVSPRASASVHCCWPEKGMACCTGKLVSKPLQRLPPPAGIVGCLADPCCGPAGYLLGFNLCIKSAVPVLTPAAPTIRLNNNGAAANQMDVIQGSSYAACSSSVLPTAAAPCELGATAISYTGANLTSSVVACPPASCIKTGCSGVSGRDLRGAPCMWPQATWTCPGQSTDARLTCCGSALEKPLCCSP